MEENNKVSVHIVDEERKPRIDKVIDINRHSKLTKLLNVTALVVRFIFNAISKKGKLVRRTGEVSTRETRHRQI